MRAFDVDEPITCLAYDNESKYLATAGGDSQIRLWHNAPGLQEKVWILCISAHVFIFLQSIRRSESCAKI